MYAAIFYNVDPTHGVGSTLYGPFTSEDDADDFRIRQCEAEGLDADLSDVQKLVFPVVHANS